jgi:polysaccharide biosynthesis/export protein PslD
MASTLAPLIALVLVACGSRITVPPLAVEDVTRLAAVANFPEGVYRLEPDDTLQIRWVFHQELNQDATVRPDGKISVTEVGDVDVAGMTTRQLEELLVAKASGRLREPVVTVTVTRFGDKTVYVGGEVGRPGALPYRRGLTALQAIMASGGFRDTAKVDSVILIRSAGKDNEFIARKLDLAAVVNTGMSERVGLAPRDVVFVPRTAVANAGIWVKQHITDLFPLIRGTNLPTIPLQ